MKRAELAKLTGLSEGYISRTAATIPGAVLRGKQWEFDETDQKFQEWLLPTQLKAVAKSLRKQGLVKRDRSPQRSQTEIIKAMRTLVTAFESCRPMLPKIRVSYKGCQWREPLSWEECRQFLEFLVAIKRSPSLEEIVEISAHLAEFEAHQLFVDYFNSTTLFKSITGGEPLPVEEAYSTPGYPPNPSFQNKPLGPSSHGSDSLSDDPRLAS